MGTLCIYLSFYKLLLCTQLYSRSICIDLKVGVAESVARGQLHPSHQSVTILCTRNSPFQKFSYYISQCIMKLQRIVLHLGIDIILIIEHHYFYYTKIDFRKCLSVFEIFVNIFIRKLLRIR